jgi:hypothetical protein
VCTSSLDHITRNDLQPARHLLLYSRSLKQGIRSLRSTVLFTVILIYGVAENRYAFSAGLTTGRL